VLASFIVVACSTYAIVLYAYFFRRKTAYRGDVPNVNELDKLVLHMAKRTVSPFLGSLHQKRLPIAKPQSQNLQQNEVEDSSKPPEADDALFNISLALADQQLFAGFAILIVMCSQVKLITTYHAAVIECMATLSFTVYESTSVIVASYLAKTTDESIKMTFRVTWRAGFMLLFMLALLVIQVPLGNRHWMRVYGMPYKCFWQHVSGNYFRQNNSENLGIMFFNIFWLFGGMLRAFRNYFPKGFGLIFHESVWKELGFILVEFLLLPRRAMFGSYKRSHEAEPAEPAEGKAIRIAFRVLWMLSWPFALFAFILAELLDSEAFGLQRSWFLILNNVYWSLEYKREAPSQHRIGDENKWGFGQLVPLLLIALPLSSLIESMYGASSLPCCSCLLSMAMC
jgi:hypothetical protein